MDSPESVLETIARISRRERRLIASFRGEGSRMAAEADKLAALVDTARALEGASIPYALIGGLAVGIHSGTPRATLDVDVAASSAARSRVSEVMEGAGFRKTGEHAHSLNFRHPSGEPVQIAFDAEFDGMISRAERFQLGGASIRVVTRVDLVAMKQRAAVDPARRKSKRLRDQADVALLQGDVPDPDEGW